MKKNVTAKLFTIKYVIVKLVTMKRPTAKWFMVKLHKRLHHFTQTTMIIIIGKLSSLKFINVNPFI